MYADRVSGAMDYAISETTRRRKLQQEFNREHGITPRTIQKEVRVMVEGTMADGEPSVDFKSQVDGMSPDELEALIAQLTEEMKLAARQEEFEQAAVLRDRISVLRGGVV
jgi:excinuclease ABC subunit B